MGYRVIDRNRYAKNYSYVRAPKVTRVEDPVYEPPLVPPSEVKLVANGLWIGGVNTGLPNGYYDNGTDVGVPDGNWCENQNQGIPNGYYVNGDLQNHKSTLGIRMSSNLQEEISYINTSLPMDLGRSQTLILSNNLEDI
jgi:hypothetical protein